MDNIVLLLPKEGANDTREIEKANMRTIIFCKFLFPKPEKTVNINPELFKSGPSIYYVTRKGGRGV